jgi:hypothetical protein
MLTKPDWLNKSVKTKLRHSSWPNMILQPHTWTLGIGFTDRDADVKKSKEWKRMYPSSGMRATCLSRGRKRIWFWCLRVAVDEKLHPPMITVIITFRKSYKTLTTPYRSSRKKTPFTNTSEIEVNTMPGGRRVQCLSAKLANLGNRRDWPVSLPGRFTRPERASNTHWMGGGGVCRFDTVITIKNICYYWEPNSDSLVV